MCLEGDMGRLGEDPGPWGGHLSELGPAPVAWEMLQSLQTATQITTNVFQSVLEFLVLFQWAEPPFLLSSKCGLGRGHSKDSSPDCLHG